MPKITVKKSKIDGRGVFAARDFKKGEVVIRWDLSHQLTPKEAGKLPETEKRYLVYFNKKYFLMQPPARYLNHSCEANTDPKNFCDQANRKIKKGEEITTDYGKQAEIGFQMACHCQSKKCRGIIRKISARR